MKKTTKEKQNKKVDFLAEKLNINPPPPIINKKDPKILTPVITATKFSDVAGQLFALFALIAVATTIAYSNHFHNGFHLDDFHTIVENSYIKNIDNLSLFFKDGNTFSSLPSNRSYRPVVTASLAIDYWLGSGSMEPFQYHLSMFIVFILQGLLMILFFWKLLEMAQPAKYNVLIAGAATALYLLHPVNSETINYVISRSDSYSTFFIVLAFVMYLYSPLCQRLHLYLVPVVIGALTKEPAIMFGPLLVVYKLCFEHPIDFKKLIFDVVEEQKIEKETIDKLKKVVLSSLPAIISVGFLFLFLNYMRPKTFSPGGFSVLDYIITQPYVILHYVVSLFLPLWLSIDTDWTLVESVWDIKVYVGGAFILTLIYLMIITSQEQKLRLICFGIAWFLLALLPTSVIPLAEVLNYHRPFFPYVGLIIALFSTLIVYILPKYKLINSSQQINSAFLTFLIIAISIYGVGTYQRNKVWKTEESIWFDATVKSPKNGRALMNYGLILMSKGDYVGAENYFVKAQPFIPYYSYLYVNWGILKERMGQLEEAEKNFQKAVEYGGIYPTTFYFYGKFLSDQKRYTEAINNLTKALELAPNHNASQRLLMYLYQEQADFANLEKVALMVLQQDSNNLEAKFYLDAAKNKKSPLQTLQEHAAASKTPEAYLDLSLKYYQAKQYEKCIEAANEALKIKPDFPEAYNNICTAYNELKQWDKAVAACEQAIKFNPNFTLAKNNLAWALEQQKQSTNNSTLEK